jgi:hypothetical protein
LPILPQIFNAAKDSTDFHGRARLDQALFRSTALNELTGDTMTNYHRSKAHLPLIAKPTYRPASSFSAAITTSATCLAACWRSSSGTASRSNTSEYFL